MFKVILSPGKISLSFHSFTFPKLSRPILKTSYSFFSLANFFLVIHELKPPSKRSNNAKKEKVRLFNIMISIQLRHISHKGRARVNKKGQGACEQTHHPFISCINILSAWFPKPKAYSASFLPSFLSLPAIQIRRFTNIWFWVHQPTEKCLKQVK